MSDNIPFEMQAEIIKRVHPVKSLIRFKSVSKQWKSLIDSSKFITHHTLNHRTDTHHLLARYNTENHDYEYVSVVDDDSFPRRKFYPVVPPTVDLVKNAVIFDCSHGLVCLYGYGADKKNSMIVLWNPSIRKTVGITLPTLPHGSAIVFGVCPKTSDPKIVRITRSCVFHIVSWKVEVFTLGSGVWRNISMNIHLSGSTEFKSNDYDNQVEVVIDGVIYWVAHDSSKERDLIISFDLISEEFGEVALPDSLAHGNMSVSKLNEFLVVFDIEEFNEGICDVWMMLKNGFVKLFSLGDYDDYTLYDIKGFRRNGQPVRMSCCRLHDGSSVTKLKAYEHSVKRSRDLGIYMPHGSAYFIEVLPRILITSYTESLLLHNHSNSIIQGY